MREHFIVLVTAAPTVQRTTVELASRLAARSNAVLLFLHVVPVRRQDGEAMLYAGVDIEQGEAEAWLRARRPSDPGVRFRHRVEAGEPEEVVARFVDEHDVDLVVAEEPPRSWISEALWRGLAERLIRRVDCPVVIGGPGFLQSMAPSEEASPAQLGPTRVADLLNAMVEARVDALRCWMDHRADAVRRIATSETVRTAVVTEGHDQGIERRLHVELEQHRRALGAIDWQLTTAHRVRGRSITPLGGPALADFFQRVRQEGQSASLPLALDDALERLVILAGARMEEGGLLLFAFDAEDHFLRILGQPGPLPSFETYAFDASGLMLSNSRFPDHLQEAGLLPAEGLQTPLRLRVAEPSEGPVEGWPLTRMARDATRRQDGFDTRGYLDYRGTPVVGAWRWVPEYGFGVTAEVDVRVARG